jgi:protein-disulfide isomerase
MSSKKRALTLSSVITLVFVIFACTKKVESSPSFIFKPAPSKNAAIKVNGKVVTEGEVFKGVESELYDAQKKVFDLKMAKIKSYIIQKFIDAHPDKKGMSNDEFLKAHIAKNIVVSEAEIKAFAKERNIPQLNDDLKKRISRYLEEGKKREAIENWLNEQMKESPVEIYIKKPQRPVFNVQAGDSPWTGGANAKVTIVEFSDFQCPFCSKGATLIGEIKKKYGDKVKVVFKNFPLPFHTDAAKAAEASLCAHEQGKFWELHDKMFAEQNDLKVSSLKSKAKSLGLDSVKFDKCLDSGKFKAKVEADMKQGQDVSVRSTPTFFVNGQMVNGAQPIEVFSEIIDEALAK